VAAEAEN